MERLPTELVIQILDYMSTKELEIIGFISSEYRSLVIPFLFRRIRPWWSSRGVRDLIACLKKNHMISSVFRVLDVQGISVSREPLEEIRQIMEIIAGWEGLILPANEHIPLEVFDGNTKLQLRRLEFSEASSPAGPKRSHLLLNILPSCVNLIDLEITGLEEDWFETRDPSGSATTIWMNRLEKYRGPSYPLNYLHNGTALRQLRSTTSAPSPMLKKLGRFVGQQLLALHVDFSLAGWPNFSLTEKDYLPPSLFPSSFPNLRYVSWFLIESQPESVSGDPGLPQTKFPSDEATLDVNRALFDAIQQLHCLRHVWFTSHYIGKAPIEPVLTFVEEVQRMSLPYLHAISLWMPWAPPSDPWSYAFRKKEVQSVNGGGDTKWVHETNVPVVRLIN